MARLETRAGGRERGWKAEANSPSFYPILESECLAPLTLETGCTAGSYTHHHSIFLSTPASFATTTTTTTTASSFSTDYNPLPSNPSFSPASVSRSASLLHPLSTLCSLANLSAGTIDLRGTLVHGRIGTASRFRVEIPPRSFPPNFLPSPRNLSIDLQIFLASMLPTYQ